MNDVICSAIKSKKLISFDYDNGVRIVEPYCYGISRTGKEVLRAYQVDGESTSGEFIGWKLFSLKKVCNIKILNQQFNTTREGYNPQDSVMTEIFCNL